MVVRSMVRRQCLRWDDSRPSGARVGYMGRPRCDDPPTSERGSSVGQPSRLTCGCWPLRGRGRLMGYNDAVSKISINLTDVYDEATKMQTDLDSIETTWSGTMKQWDRLNVSWAGDTQPLVEAFLADLNKVQDQIFGTGKPKDPSKPA